MALRMRKNMEEKKGEELQLMGNVFFSLLREHFSEFGELNCRLSLIEPVLDSLAEENEQQKLDLCHRINELVSEECQQLKEVVENEERHREIKKCFQAFTAVKQNCYFSNKDFSLLKKYFQLLAHIINSYYIVNSYHMYMDRDKDEAMEKKLDDYFQALAEDMEEMANFYQQWLLTEKIWEDCPLFEDYTATPFEVHCSEDKFLFLRKLKLMDRFKQCFAANSQLKAGIGQRRFVVDEKIKYYRDIF